jgi:hypothetical protein
MTNPKILKMNIETKLDPSILDILRLLLFLDLLAHSLPNQPHAQSKKFFFSFLVGSLKFTFAYFFFDIYNKNRRMQLRFSK